MFESLLLRTSALALALGLLLVVGCGSGATVTGTVTVNGTPLEKGNITFQPEEASKHPQGAVISNGKYTVKNLAPGKYKVNVIGGSTEGMSQSMDDKPKAVANPITPTTKGNGETVDVSSSTKEHNVKLETPK